MRISIFLLLFAFNLMAIESNEAHFNLFVYDQYGRVLGMKMIESNAKKIYVDGSTLSPTEITIKSKYITVLLKMIKQNSSIQCSEGKYIFRIYANGFDKIESGCVDSKRYTEISSVFDKMRKDIALK